MQHSSLLLGLLLAVTHIHTTGAAAHAHDDVEQAAAIIGPGRVQAGDDRHSEKQGVGTASTATGDEGMTSVTGAKGARTGATVPATGLPTSSLDPVAGAAWLVLLTPVEHHALPPLWLPVGHAGIELSWGSWSDGQAGPTSSALGPAIKAPPLEPKEPFQALGREAGAAIGDGVGGAIGQMAAALEQAGQALAAALGMGLVALSLAWITTALIAGRRMQAVASGPLAAPVPCTPAAPIKSTPWRGQYCPAPDGPESSMV